MKYINCLRYLEDITGCVTNHLVWKLDLKIDRMRESIVKYILISANKFRNLMKYQEFLMEQLHNYWDLQGEYRECLHWINDIRYKEIEELNKTYQKIINQIRI